MVRATLTPAQREVLDYIITQSLKRGYPPSLREIGQGGRRRRAINCVHQIVKILERKGYVRRIKGAARTIVPIPESEPIAALQ